MRQKRAKAYKKLMNLYHLSFGFREPYQVLVDSEMCSTSTSLKLDLARQFANTLQGDVKTMITQCSIVELYKLGSEQQQAVDLAKSFERRKCNHREAIPGDDCIASVVGDTNKHRYVIACQSQPMRARLRTVPGVPIVHLNRTVMVLEPPSDATLKTKRQLEEAALLPSAAERGRNVADGIVEEPKKKKKGPKAPNPLSVKKKKVRPNETQPTSSGVKRKREEDHDSQPNEVVTDTKPKRKRRKKVAKPLEQVPD